MTARSRRFLTQPGGIAARQDPEFRIIRLHTRYRRDLIEERTREKNRTEKLLESDLLTELPDVFAAQAGARPDGGCRDVRNARIARPLRAYRQSDRHRNRNTGLNQSPVFSSLPIFDVSHGGPQAPLQCP
jgi:hypothetical protein